MHKREEKLKKCFKEGEREGHKHKGLRRIAPSEALKQEHLEKALHNLKAIRVFYDTGFSDWSASAAFYTLYHCLLGILARGGYESKNQSCTFALTEKLIENGEITEVTQEEIREIFDMDRTETLEQSTQLLNIREEMQYSTKTAMADDKFRNLTERTKLLLEKLRREIEK
jgi:uncharacterized protein (UPF0332 family)